MIAASVVRGEPRGASNVDKTFGVAYLCGVSDIQEEATAARPPRTPRPPSAAAIRKRLAATAIRDGAITLDGVAIGRMVAYGKRGTKGAFGARTVYGSRIHLPGGSVEEEAAAPKALLDKVSRALAKAAREGRWSPSPAPATPQRPVAVPDGAARPETPGD